jgi:regulator of RNase E activity RraA
MPNEEPLSRYSLGTVEGALARWNRRPRGQGIALPGLTPLWRQGAERRRIAGRAVTVTLCAEEGFPFGRRENVEWWRHIERQPGPKVIVAQMLGPASGVKGDPGAGAACGILSASVYVSLGCAGFITDGYVRDAAQMESAGLLVAARGATLRHGVPHVVRFDEPVKVCGMDVQPGDMVLADAEGALAFPAEWMSELPGRLRQAEARVNPVLEFCRGGRRTADEIAQRIAEMK